MNTAVFLATDVRIWTLVLRGFRIAPVQSTLPVLGDADLVVDRILAGVGFEPTTFEL